MYRYYNLLYKYIDIYTSFMLYYRYMSKKKPSLKQEKFTEAFVKNGGNATKAALEVYDTHNKKDASNIGYQNLKKPHIQELVSSKIKDLKNSILTKVKNDNLMGLALETANDDLMDEDPKVRSEARKFILKVTEFLSETERRSDGPQHQHIHFPKWKG